MKSFTPHRRRDWRAMYEAANARLNERVCAQRVREDAVRAEERAAVANMLRDRADWIWDPTFDRASRELYRMADEVEGTE